MDWCRWHPTPLPGAMEIQCTEAYLYNQDTRHEISNYFIIRMRAHNHIMRGTLIDYIVSDTIIQLRILMKIQSIRDRCAYIVRDFVELCQRSTELRFTWHSKFNLLRDQFAYIVRDFVELCERSTELRCTWHRKISSVGEMFIRRFIFRGINSWCAR